MISASRYFLPILLAAASCALGQTPAPTPTSAPADQTSPAQTAAEPMPTDPAALLTLAAKKNGLQNVGTEPLHIKATYQLLDDKGAVKETGTIDEIRVSDKKYKLTYSSPSFSQTDYSTDAGLFRVGDPNWPSYPLFAAHNSLYPFFPTGDVVSKFKLGTETRTLGAAQLICIKVLNAKDIFPYLGLYCLGPNVPVLRLVEKFHGASQILYSSLSEMGGAYVPKDTTYLERGKPLVRIHLNSVSVVPRIDVGVFTHPESATKIPRRLTTLPIRAWPKLLNRIQPDAAQGDHLEGDFVVQVVVGADGKVISARPLSGPPILRQAALDAVQRWIYEPIRVNGEPAEAVLEFEIDFH